MSEVVKAGKLFVFSSGEYSDYSYDGHFLALEELTTETSQQVVDLLKTDIRDGKVKRYGVTLAPDSEGYEIQGAIKEGFIARLITTGKVMAVDCEEIHIGSYGQLEIMDVSV